MTPAPRSLALSESDIPLEPVAKRAKQCVTAPDVVPSSTPSASDNRCKYHQRGWCYYGDKCRNFHDPDVKESFCLHRWDSWEAEEYNCKSTLCKYFSDEGGSYCTAGDQCRFSHGMEELLANGGSLDEPYGTWVPLRCQFFGSEFGCASGDDCRFIHDTDGEAELRRKGAREWTQDWDETAHKRPNAGAHLLPREEQAALLFVVDWRPQDEKMDGLHGEDTFERTGPMRLRVVGDTEPLGCWYDKPDSQLGVDLFWEGDRWVSTLVPAVPAETLRFTVQRVEQSETHPGVLQGSQRTDIHDNRTFLSCPWHAVTAPSAGSVAIVRLQCPELFKLRCLRGLKVIPRRDAVVTLDGISANAVISPPKPGRHKCYTFDAPNGKTLIFYLYAPAGYDNNHPSGFGGEEGWPMLMFFHSMHGRLDGDNNLLFESDTPVRMLGGDADARCPRALKERFVVLAPQCPEDREKGGDCSMWLRKGWFEVSSFDPDMTAALGALVRGVLATMRSVDKHRVCATGASMGGYAALELAARWPNSLAAIAPVAAHYDLDPVEDLVARLVDPHQRLPAWFFHATNDTMCPFEPMNDLIQKLRIAAVRAAMADDSRSKADIKFTFFDDTWSMAGHCADRVAYWGIRGPDQEQQPPLGEELFEWLARQRSLGVLPPI